MIKVYRVPPTKILNSIFFVYVLRVTIEIIFRVKRYQEYNTIIMFGLKLRPITKKEVYYLTMMEDKSNMADGGNLKLKSGKESSSFQY